MATSAANYRLQIFVQPEVRKALREVVAQEDVTIQEWVTLCLIEKLREYPAGKKLELPSSSAHAG